VKKFIQDPLLVARVLTGPVPSGFWRHFKGGVYRVHCVAKHSENPDDWYVVYENAKSEWFVRPLVMWLEIVDRPEIPYKGPRFFLEPDA